MEYIFDKTPKLDMRTKNFLTVCALLFIGIAFYILNNAVPFRNDDYMYQFVFLTTCDYSLPTPVDIHRPITNISELFSSQYNHYMIMNGRCPVHFLVQLFCGILGKDLFNIITSFIYIFNIYYSCKLIFKTQVSWLHILSVNSIMWIVFPVGYFYAHGIAFSINYLWSMTICLYCLYIFIEAKEKNNVTFLSIINVIICFIGGWSHESFSIPVAGMMFVFSIVMWKKSSCLQKTMAICFCIGTLLIIIAPGTLLRFAHTHNESFQLSKFIDNRMMLLYNLKRPFLYLIILLISTSLFKKSFLCYCKNYIHTFTLLCFSFLFMFLLGNINQRALLGTEAYSYILFISIMYSITDKYRKHIKICSLLITAFFLVFAYPQIVKYNYIVNENFSKSYKKYICNETNDITISNINIPFYIKKYVFCLGNAEWELDVIRYLKKNNKHTIINKTENIAQMVIDKSNSMR